MLLGGIGQLLVQVPDLRRLGLLATPSGELRHPALGRIARLLLPAVFGLAAVQVMVFVNTLLASLLPVGSISFLYYADRVMEFPLGIFGIALASASLPAMARQAAAGDTRGVAGTLNFALRLAVYVSVPATVGLVLLSTPITRVLFQRGRFGPEDTAATAIALIWYAVGLVGFAGARIAAQAFYAVARPGVAVRARCARDRRQPAGRGDPHASDGARRPRPRLVDRCLRESLRPVVGGPATTSVHWVAGPWRSPPRARWRRAHRSPSGACSCDTWRRPAGFAQEAAWLAVTIAGGAVVFLGASTLLGSPERATLLGVLPSRRRR